MWGAWDKLKTIVADQAGSIPVGNLLVIGMIIIPIVLVLIIFRVELFTWMVDQWVELQDAGNKAKTTF